MAREKQSAVTEHTPQTGQFFSHLDERGSWTRVFESRLFEEMGLPPRQSSVSFTKSARTLRGLHSMQPSAEEWKLVTCVKGEVWDVAVNVNRRSADFGVHRSWNLRGSNADWVFIPPGWAHGFVTLSDDVVLSYTMSVEFDSILEEGYRYDEPTFRIPWPVEPLLVSPKDLSFKYLEGA